ncbi:MAG: hypothetical protein PVH63_07175 [Balneolaceae bacterium]|jgi:hypothetical protein
MERKIQEKWHEIRGTGIYATPHYIAKSSELELIFQRGIFENGEENLLKVTNNQVITSRLIMDKRMVFNFFPLGDGNRYIIEGITSERIIKEQELSLPHTLKKILVERRRIRYN